MKNTKITINNKAINNVNLIKLSGLSAIASGLIYIAIQPLHPTDVIDSVSTSAWFTVHAISLTMDVLGLTGLTGLYVKQSAIAGRIGLIGYLLFSLFYLLSFAFHFIEAFVMPIVVKESPKFVDGLLGLISGHSSEINLGNIPAIFALFGISYILGGLLFGIATYRANILPRFSGALLATGSALTVLGGTLPHPLNRVLAIPVGIALIWMGFALFKNRK